MGIGQYIGLSIIAIISMAAGSQLVHQHYQPWNDLEEYVEREIVRRKKESD